MIDPNRTISAGRVDIGAFRTYPENYTPPNASASEYQSIPLSKIEDFGVHANQYYPLEVQVFKSSLDTELLALLWNKYWVNTLSQSPLISVSCLLYRFKYNFSFLAPRIAHMLRLNWLTCIRSWRRQQVTCRIRSLFPQRRKMRYYLQPPRFV